MSGYPQPATQLFPFALPGQFIGVWASFDPTAGNYTYDVGPGYALSSLWFPVLTDATQIYFGDDATGSPFYTTGSGGSESVPLPSGTTAITLLSVNGTGAVMPVYVTSLSFDPFKTTPSSPAVASVTATAPLSSTGGANPNIALSTPLAVTFGGTGTAAPSIVAGSGIAVTGTWPNQTIATTGGGVASVTALGPLASSGGTTPQISLSGIVPVAKGGTGTASPGLISGDGSVVISGSWPNQSLLTYRNALAGIGQTGTDGSATINTVYQILGATATVAQNTSGTAPYAMYVDQQLSNYAYGIVRFFCLSVASSPGTLVTTPVGFNWTLVMSNVVAL